MLRFDKTKELYERAKNVLVGGVNSPVRAMKPYPLFIKEAKGSRLRDIDGNEYIDYCLGFGAIILGHAYDYVVERVKEQLEKGSIYGTCNEYEVILAEKIVKHIKSAESVRFVNTGTEATMHAIRLARGYTKRKKIIKIEGSYHGAFDYVLVKAGSGATTFGIPTSEGIPEESIKNTIVVPFNDEDAIEKVIRENRDEIACLITEPILGNAGLILPRGDYLKFLREITEENDILLIFDEIITGFRISLGGAQEYYKVYPDITTLGKVLGGGFPIGAIAARKDIMENFAPVGKVYQAGTFSGNPITMVAGIATLEILERENVYDKLNYLGRKLYEGILEMINRYGLRCKVYQIGSMFQIYFTDKDIVNYQDALSSNKELFLEFQRRLLFKGIYLPPSQFECNFISYSHSYEDINETLIKMEEVFKEIWR